MNGSESLFSAPRELAESVLSGAMGTAHPDCDKALQALAQHTLGLSKSDAKFQRKARRLADELANHIVKGASLKHEIKRLEDLLAWIHKTGQPIEEIRVVIEKTISRKIARGEARGCASDGVGCYRDDCNWPDQPCPEGIE